MPSRVARHVGTGEPIRLAWESDRITAVQSASVPDRESDLFLCPGFVDIQINGFAGIHFGSPDLTTSRVREVAKKLWETGTTYFLPTLITDSIERMAAALVRLRDAAGEPDLGRAIVGFHLEGPYLSHLDGPRGAHPLEFCKDPDWDEFRRLQDAAGGRIRVVTLAPERAGALAFIERAVAGGVRIAIGHTGATRQQILAAVAAGASLSTHLGNAAHDQLQRHHNYIYDQLGEDALLASLIVDGHHLPPHLVKIFVRVKGIERTILISDAVQYAGLPPGIYDGGYRQFEVRGDGFIGVVGEPRLAGSGLLMVRGVENLVRFTGLDLASAIRTATEIPARFLGLGDRLGTLAPGREASFLLVRWHDQRLSIVEAVLAGQVVHSAAQ